MKPRRSFVIFSPPGDWRIGMAAEDESRIVPVAVDSDKPAQVAAALAESLRAAGHEGEPVLLALGSGRCLSATVSTAGLPRRGRHQAALYRLEERLPLAAEDLSADFLFHNGTAIGVCARAGDIGPLTDALAAERIDLAAACPTAILALGGARHEAYGPTLLDADALLWQTSRRIEVVWLAEATPVNCLDIPAEPGDIALALATQVIAREAPIRVALVNLDDGLTAAVAELADVTVGGEAMLSLDDAALRAADHVLRGDERPALDLLGGGGTGRHAVRQLRPALLATAAAAGLLCACLILACWARGARYAAMASRAEDRKAAAFRQLFPREPLPVGIESRLRAVESQLRGANRTAQPNGLGGAAPDALSSLHDLLAHLPADARYRIAELDIDGTRLSMQGEVSTHGDADAVATALRREARFVIDDPQTQQMDGNVVRFSISGAVQGTADEAPTRRAP